MSTITTSDGTEIFYKDWGRGRPSYADSAPLSAKLVKNETLKTYHGFPHGMPTTQAETINADLLDFIQS